MAGTIEGHLPRSYLLAALSSYVFGWAWQTLLATSQDAL